MSTIKMPKKQLGPIAQLEKQLFAAYLCSADQALQQKDTITAREFLQKADALVGQDFSRGQEVAEITALCDLQDARDRITQLAIDQSMTILQFSDRMYSSEQLEASLAAFEDASRRSKYVTEVKALKTAIRSLIDIIKGGDEVAPKALLDAVAAHGKPVKASIGRPSGSTITIHVYFADGGQIQFDAKGHQSYSSYAPVPDGNY